MLLYVPDWDKMFAPEEYTWWQKTCAYCPKCMEGARFLIVKMTLVTCITSNGSWYSIPTSVDCDVYTSQGQKICKFSMWKEIEKSFIILEFEALLSSY